MKEWLMAKVKIRASRRVSNVDKELERTMGRLTEPIVRLTAS